MEPFDLSQYHPENERTVVVEATEQAVWAYLTEARRGAVTLAGIVCSLMEPLPDLAKAEAAMAAGGPPPLALPFASKEALQPVPSRTDFEIDWNEACEAVLIRMREIPWLVMVPSEGAAYSRALVQAGPYGLPWEDELLNHYDFLADID
ncbi:MAG: hypothetical protein D6722_13200 [Bacteroidetes bacterium]|nr:MAG: hypothetical protein D6722_13200 [Bacteroidota bacterium]